ncbi:MAG: hypothetical protein EBQ92_08560 [Proteobacteria bacterium]|nr:hypothetical protein [Pseudomonadota bacterium]
MLSSVHFFETPQEIPGFFDSFFQGLFLVRGLPTFFQVGLLLSFASCFLTALKFTQTQQTIWKRLSAFLAFLTLTLAAFLLFQPWDELFISLRHAQHLAEIGNFSFNRFEKIEGIVDFLPFYLLGLLNKISLPLIETNFLIEILAGWFCILGGRRILINLGGETFSAWSYPILVVYPPLLLNTGNGFTVLFFTAFILWSLIFLVFEGNQKQRWYLGCFLVSLLPLIRLEGLWFSVLLYLFLVFFNKPALSAKKAFITPMIFLFPVIGLSLWRIYTFGSALPVPIVYKSSIGNLFFFLLGLRNLFLDLVAGGAVFFICLISCAHFEHGKNGGNLKEKDPLKILSLLFLFSLPYYLSGGDWFPPAWGRYLFPFSYFSFLMGIFYFSRFFTEAKNHPSFSSPLLIIFFLAILYFPSGSFRRLGEVLFTPKTSLSGILNKKTGRGNQRIHTLSRLGYHLKETTSAQTVIGSSELATIMFFADREALDLLGVTNLEIAQSPLRSNPLFFSKANTRNELPHLIFKRTKPSLLFEKQPGIFYAFDFMLRDLLDNYHPEELTEAEILLALQRWDRNFLLLNNSLFGGLGALQRNGYEPVVIKYGTDFVALYFVSKAVRDEHFSEMKKKGMAYKTIKSNRL